MIKYIVDEKDLEGKIILLRLDLNVPVIEGQVKDTYRLERVIETLDFLRARKAKTIIISHCEGKDSKTLLPMWKYLNGFLPLDFSESYFTPEAIAKITKMENGGVLLFENLRINPGEKENDKDFAKKLAQMADIYVNDAFAVSHRKHASIVSVPEFLPHFGGILLKQEIENLSKAFNPKKPFVFILGGAKFDTKIPLIEKYLEKADTVFVCGALAHNIYKEMGFEIGKSLVSEGEFGIKEKLQNKKLVVPVDVTVTNEKGEVSFKKSNEVEKNETIVDAGIETLEQLKNIIATAQTIIWNGPVGNYEIGFSDKTEQFAEIISNCSGETIVGGGDTVASINKLELSDKFTFVSTGGGAMLDFLVNETLPGMEALER
ncbi:MAG: phosphoglycerate kinase [Candidatus Paceibacterota bacterium]